MYNESYDRLISKQGLERYDRLEEQIRKEKRENGDAHKIAKLREAQLLSDLFADNVNGMYGKYRQPW